MFCVIISISYSFKEADAFIGFQKDTPAAVLFQATNLLRSACEVARQGLGECETKWTMVLERSQFNWDVQEDENREAWNAAVSGIYYIM